MNYIQQAYTGKIGFWKYTIVPLLFLGLVALNFLSVKLLNLDMDAIMKAEIAKKGSNRVLFDMLITFVIFLVILFIWVKKVHKQTITSLTTSRKKIDWKRVFFAFFLWGGAIVVLTFISYFLSPEDLQLNFKPIPFLKLAIIAIIMIPLQTSFEEYFFRGYLMQGLGAKFKSRGLPLIVTSLVFGLMHLGNPEVEKMGYIILVYYIGTGLFLGVITLMDEGLELALGFHAANNLISALLITADWTAFQTNSIFKQITDPTVNVDVLTPVFIFFPILFFIFYKKYGWSNWKEKLFGKIMPPVKLNEDEFIA